MTTKLLRSYLKRFAVAELAELYPTYCDSALSKADALSTIVDGLTRNEESTIGTEIARLGLEDVRRHPKSKWIGYKIALALAFGEEPPPTDEHELAQSVEDELLAFSSRVFVRVMRDEHAIWMRVALGEPGAFAVTVGQPDPFSHCVLCGMCTSSQHPIHFACSA